MLFVVMTLHATVVPGQEVAFCAAVIAWEVVVLCVTLHLPPAVANVPTGFAVTLIVVPTNKVTQ